MEFIEAMRTLKEVGIGLLIFGTILALDLLSVMVPAMLIVYVSTGSLN
jgi:hypothetical protein